MNWKIEWMNVKPVDGNLANVVVTAGWRCVAEQDDAAVDAYGSCGFTAPADKFTPYDKLTEAQVLGWCWDNGVDKDEVEASLTKQLADKLNPPIVNKPLPWAA